MGEVLIAGMAAMLICIFLGPKFIEYLRVREFGQHIREDGPQEHHTKAGTPTMGGLIVFASICVPFLVLSDRDAQSLAVFGVALGCAALGFADDYIKIVKRRSLGLSGRWKLLGQLVLALGLWWVARHEVGLEPTLYFRIGDGSIDLGPVLYFVLVFLVIAGTSNGVNLTDGLDGLAAGSCAIVLLAYTAIAFVANEQQNLALLSACLVGACIGFLWFNAFPASIFMGDTGSLGLGGAIGALAVMTQTEVLLIIIGGIFVIEALSVLLQVFAFKTFRRRVLLMAPLHHHFEMMAWSETKIMLRFWIIAAVCSGIGFTLYQQSIGELMPEVEVSAAGPIDYGGQRRRGAADRLRSAGCRTTRPLGRGDRRAGAAVPLPDAGAAARAPSAKPCAATPTSRWSGLQRHRHRVPRAPRPLRRGRLLQRLGRRPDDGLPRRRPTGSAPSSCLLRDRPSNYPPGVRRPDRGPLGFVPGGFGGVMRFALSSPGSAPHCPSPTAG